MWSIEESENTYKQIVDQNGNDIATVWSTYCDADETAKLFLSAHKLAEENKSLKDLIKLLESCILSEQESKTQSKTLLDEFAGLAMQAIIQSDISNDWAVADITESAYLYARTMIAEKNKPINN